MGTVAPPTAVSGSVSLAERLRVETAPCHRALEAQVDLEARLRTIETYAALLAVLHPFHRVLEDRLAAWTAWADLDPPLDLHERRKTHLLATDLTALARLPNGAEKTGPPRLPSFAAGLGALYVVEGATLGGAVVARRTAARLGLGPTSGLAYFTSYGSRRGERWAAFRASLASYAATASDSERDDVVRGAASTFEALGAWLEQRV